MLTKESPARLGNESRIIPKKGCFMLLAIVLMIVGLLLLVYAADRLVYGAAVLARSMGMPPLIIGMTVVGVGISLPELVVSTTAPSMIKWIWRSETQLVQISLIFF